MRQKSYYIKNLKRVIDYHNKQLNDENTLDIYKSNHSVWLKIANDWMALLNSEKVSQKDAEDFFEQVCKCEKQSKMDSLFIPVCFWLKYCGYVNDKIKRLWRECFTALANYIDKYYEEYIERGEATLDNIIGVTAAKRWAKILNFSSVTQAEVDTVMKLLLAHEDPPGLTLRSLCFDFRNWAELEGFKVISKNKMIEHISYIIQLQMAKYYAESGKEYKFRKSVFVKHDFD